MREFLLSLGVLLGVVIVQPDPVLAARLFRDSQALYATAEVKNGLGKDALNLVRAGDTLRLILEYQLAGGASGICAHEISFEPLSQIFRVKLSETQGVHQTISAEAAADIFCRFYGLRIESLDKLQLPLQTEFAVRLIDASNPGLESTVLWNYRRPQASIRVATLSELAW